MPYTPLNDAHTPPNAADTPFIDAETVRAVLHLKEKWQAEIRGQLREVEAERDSWRRVAERIEEENQALAAHVDQLDKLVSDVLSHCPDWPDSPQSVFLEKLADLRTSAPTTSLARLKAEAAAEALKYASRRFTCEHGDFVFERAEVSEWMAEEAAEYHRQADPDLCVDEGCPHHGTPHVCINRQAKGGER